MLALLGLTTLHWLKADLVVYANPSSASSSWVSVGECFFWYPLTWVVPDKGPLNGCVCARVRITNKIVGKHWFATGFCDLNVLLLEPTWTDFIYSLRVDIMVDIKSVVIRQSLIRNLLVCLVYLRVRMWESAAGLLSRLPPLLLAERFLAVNSLS